MEVFNSSLISVLGSFTLYSLIYIVICLIGPWIPAVRNVLGVLHTLVVRILFPRMTIASVFLSSVFVGLAVTTFAGFVDAKNPLPFLLIPFCFFVLGLGGVFSLNMMVEAIVFRAKKSGAMPNFGDDKGLGSPMSLIGMRPPLEPTYKRAPIIRFLLTGDEETLLPKLRPFVPSGWV